MNRDGQSPRNATEPGVARFASIAEREVGLQRRLSKAQIGMIGLGGAIGTGLFIGSGLAINYAGPAVIVSYVLASLVALAMVFTLSEMAVMHPTAGSFGTYAELYLSSWVGFLVRYTYWIAQVISVAGEAVAAEGRDDFASLHEQRYSLFDGRDGNRFGFGKPLATEGREPGDGSPTAFG